jgi:peptide deformylase
VIIETEGEQVEIEGCLSLPGVYGKVRRPARVVVEYLNRHGKKVRTEGFGLLAICICHELDHLDGILFDEKVIEFVEFENEEK